jgi:hypothetical protein
VLVSVAVLLAGGCTATGQVPAGSSPAPSEVVSSSDRVADFFDPAESHHDDVWARAGRPVDRDELATYPGAAHCDWQAVTFMALNWPLGTVSRDYGASRQYARDADGVLHGRVAPPVVDVRLPADARDSGYRLGDLQLWLASSDEDGVYLRAGTDIERWPEVDPPVYCR